MRPYCILLQMQKKRNQSQPQKFEVQRTNSVLCIAKAPGKARSPANNKQKQYLWK